MRRPRYDEDDALKVTQAEREAARTAASASAQKQGIGSAIGGGIGALAGGALGTFALPGLGTAAGAGLGMSAGGALGGAIGGYLGDEDAKRAEETLAEGEDERAEIIDEAEARRRALDDFMATR